MTLTMVLNRWFRSHLLSRSQYVRRDPSRLQLCTSYAAFFKVRCWGWCCLFLTPLTSSLIECHGLSPYFYADDIQVYGPCRHATVDALAAKVSGCVGDIASWMRSNRLQLKFDETEVLWCSTRRHTYQLPTAAVSIAGVSMASVSSVRDLGIYIYTDLVMRTHV